MKKIIFVLTALVALTLTACQQPTGGDTADPVVPDTITTTYTKVAAADTYTKVVDSSTFNVYECIETNETQSTRTTTYYLGTDSVKNTVLIDSSYNTSFGYKDTGAALEAGDALTTIAFVNDYYLNGTSGTFAQTGMGAQALVINVGELRVYDGTAYYTAAFKSLNSGKDSLMLNDGFDDSNTANVNEGDLT